MIPIEYTVVRSSRRKTAAIKINDHSIEVRVPTWVSDKWISTWVESRRLWIEKNQLKLQRNMSESCLNLEQDGYFPYKGSTLRIKWVIGSKSGVTLEGDDLLVTLSSRSKKAELEQLKLLTQKWCKSEAESYISTRLMYWSKVMGLHCKSMKIKGYRRRWGSCNSEGVLTFNWRLIFADQALVDYVVIHELAHIQELNHGPKFWELVAEFCPDYKNLKTKLHMKSGWLIW